MSRYVDTDQIKYSRVIIRTQKDEHSFSEKVEYVASVKEIDAMPTADVVPVKHGHWKKERIGADKIDKCSVCGGSYLPCIKSCNYCPFCGALMDEVTK